MYFSTLVRCTRQRIANRDPELWMWAVWALGLTSLALAIVLNGGGFAGPDWASAIFYTLSTIAQTLAAGFAVLAAFVIFRIGGIEAEAQDRGARLVERLCNSTARTPQEESLWEQALLDADWHALLQHTCSPVRASSDIIITRLHARLDDYRSRSESLRRELHHCLPSTFSAIAMSLVMLPFGHILARHLVPGFAIIAAVGGTALYALGSYGRLIRQSLGRTKFMQATQVDASGSLTRE